MPMKKRRSLTDLGKVLKGFSAGDKTTDAPFRRCKTGDDAAEDKPSANAPFRRCQTSDETKTPTKTRALRTVSDSSSRDFNPETQSNRSPKTHIRRTVSGNDKRRSRRRSGRNKSPESRPLSRGKSPMALRSAKEMIMAPVTIAAWTGQAVVQAGTKTGQAVAQAGAITGKGVVQAGTLVGNTAKQTANVVVNTGSAAIHAVEDAGHAVVDAGANVSNTVVSGSKAIIGGTTNTMVSGGKSTLKAVGASLGAIASPMQRNSYGVLKSMSMKYSSLRHVRPKKSKWEEGVEAMDELLDPNCPAYEHLTADQRTKLEGVRKLLLKGPTTKDAKLSHVPRELVLMQSEHGKNFDPSLLPSLDSVDEGSLAFSDIRSQVTPGEGGNLKRRNSVQASNHYILEEYAGVNQSGAGLLDTYEPLNDDEEASFAADSNHSTAHQEPPRRGVVDSPTASLTDASELLTDESDDNNVTVTANGNANTSKPVVPINLAPRVKPEQLFVPPEFTALDKEVQNKLFDLLQWDSINKWHFDIFALDKLTNGHSMLFAGWAILGAPYSQQAMAKELGKEYEQDPKKGYWFFEELNIPPEKLYNFIKVIEQDYTPNPYHCSIHGADVLQSLHTLIQMSAQQNFMKSCPKLHIFAVLLAALCHDVAHFGTTNFFHNKLQTELSVIYNDKSVMENWHIAHAFARMLNLDLSSPYKCAPKDVAFSKFPQSSKTSDCNLLCNATPEQFQTIRRLMVDAILHTDMTNHFEMVNSARGMLMDALELDSSSDSSTSQADNAWNTLVFMLHLADISGQAKEDQLCHGWTERCFQEFFAQGDQELALGLPISPNCDRNNVLIPESQVGFIKFVVEPAFEVLGEYIPMVQMSVLPIIHGNMMHYLEQQQEADAKLDMEKELSMKEENRRLHTLEESAREEHARMRDSSLASC